MNNQTGMTLVEILVALTISTIVGLGIYQTFISQNQSNEIQQQLVRINQGMRSALDLMAREIRMAGYDPDETGLYGITAISAGSIAFNADINEDGGAPGDGESFLYEVYDADLNGYNGKLRRTPNGSAVVERVDAFRLAFAYDSDQDGNLDLSPEGHVIWAVETDGNWFRLDTNDDGVIDLDDAPGAAPNGTISGVDTQTPVNLDDIRAVRVWLLLRSDRTRQNYTNNVTYVAGNRIITPGDNFMRRLLPTTIYCRNIGL